jgi:hypothetical protein
MTLQPLRAEFPLYTVQEKIFFYQCAGTPRLNRHWAMCRYVS